MYLGTPSKIAVIDHERKRTLELRKEGFPDAGSSFVLIIDFSMLFHRISDITLFD